RDIRIGVLMRRRVRISRDEINRVTDGRSGWGDRTMSGLRDSRVRGFGGSRVGRITAAGLASLALALAGPGVIVQGGQGTSSAMVPTATIKLFDGASLANFDTWLVDHHDTDPAKVFTGVGQIEGQP